MKNSYLLNYYIIVENNHSDIVKYLVSLGFEDNHQTYIVPYSYYEDSPYIYCNKLGIQIDPYGNFSSGRKKVTFDELKKESERWNEFIERCTLQKLQL